MAVSRRPQESAEREDAVPHTSACRILLAEVSRASAVVFPGFFLRRHDLAAFGAGSTLARRRSCHLGVNVAGRAFDRLRVKAGGRLLHDLGIGRRARLVGAGISRGRTGPVLSACASTSSQERGNGGVMSCIHSGRHARGKRLPPIASWSAAAKCFSNQPFGSFLVQIRPRVCCTLSALFDSGVGGTSRAPECRVNRRVDLFLPSGAACAVWRFRNGGDYLSDWNCPRRVPWLKNEN